MMVTDRTATKVVDAVHVLAKEAQKKNPNLTPEQARAEVWKRYPGLVAAWRLANEPKV